MAQVEHVQCPAKENPMAVAGMPFLRTCLSLAQVEKQKEKGMQIAFAFALSQHKGLPCSAGPYRPLGFLVPVFPDEVGGVDDNSEAFFIEQEHHFPSKRGGEQKHEQNFPNKQVPNENARNSWRNS